jgi:glycosyltransferase involved in cell wall biosynthesis
MKVLHAYNQHRGGGGADNAARATIDVSRQRGLEVEVFTRSSHDLAPNLAGRLEAGLSAFYAPASVRKFTSLVASFRPDVVHIHEVFPLVSPWILPLCTERGIPVVMTCVDYRLTCPIVTHLYQGRICTRCTDGGEHWAVVRNCRDSVTESVTVALYNAMVRRRGLFSGHVSRFIAPSDFTRSWLIEHGAIAPERITTVSPVVELPETAVDPSRGGYVAYAGRFAPEKGIDVLLEAARLSKAPFRLSRDVRSLSAVPIPSEVEVVVTSHRAELDAFYRGARMLVFPSVWFETFGLVGAEAMSHGVPVVASRLGAMADLVEDGVDGLLFDPGDPRDLAAKVGRLWDDPALCRTLGRAGRLKAERLWTRDHHFDRTKAVYDAVCGRA